MSLSKYSFSFQHIQNDQLILPIIFKIVKMATMIVNKQTLGVNFDTQFSVLVLF